MLMHLRRAGGKGDEPGTTLQRGKRRSADCDGRKLMRPSTAPRRPSRRQSAKLCPARHATRTTRIGGPDRQQQRNARTHRHDDHVRQAACRLAEACPENGTKFVKQRHTLERVKDSHGGDELKVRTTEQTTFGGRLSGDGTTCGHIQQSRKTSLIRKRLPRYRRAYTNSFHSNRSAGDEARKRMSGIPGSVGQVPSS